MSLMLMLGIAALLVLVTAWWGIARVRRIRAEEERRSEAALAEMRAGLGSAANPPADDVATFFAGSEFDDRLGTAPRALEVSEFEEGVDIEALLADERERVAERSRETLAQITQVDVPADEPAPQASLPAAMPAAVPAAVPIAKGMLERAAAPRATQPLAVSPAAPAAFRAQPAARPTPPSVRPERGAMPLTETPQRSFVGGGDLVRHGEDGPPLREVALAWFEARGYRSSPASPAVRPIERVLRHRQDAARGYAFVVERQPVSARRIEQLQTLALSVGLKRLLVVAEAGAVDRESREQRGVRLMDRNALAAELDRLDLSIAAKIIAVARKRGSASLGV